MEVNEKVQSILEPVLSEKGYEIDSVKLSSTKEGLILEIVVDRDEPISLDDIVEISDLINPILDKEDPIQGAYTLDVSSLGAEKPLKIEKLEKYVGKYVSIHIVNACYGANNFEGTLINVDGEDVTLEIRVKTRTKTLEFKRSNIDKARLAIKF